MRFSSGTLANSKTMSRRFFDINNRLTQTSNVVDTDSQKGCHGNTIRQSGQKII